MGGEQLKELRGSYKLKIKNCMLRKDRKTVPFRGH